MPAVNRTELYYNSLMHGLTNLKSCTTSVCRSDLTHVTDGSGLHLLRSSHFLQTNSWTLPRNNDAFLTCPDIVLVIVYNDLSFCRWMWSIAAKITTNDCNFFFFLWWRRNSINLQGTNPWDEISEMCDMEPQKIHVQLNAMSRSAVLPQEPSVCQRCFPILWWYVM